MIISGVREFRKNLSNYISKAQEEQAIFIMRLDEPVAVLLGINRLKRLAEKGDKNILEELEKTEIEGKKAFSDVKKSLIQDIKHFHSLAKELSLVKPAKDLNSLLIFAKNFISNKPSAENKIAISFIVSSFVKSVSPVLEIDYYHITKNFKEILNNILSKLKDIDLKKLTSTERVILAHSQDELGDLGEHAKIIKENREINLICYYVTALVERGKIGKNGRAIFPKNNFSYKIFVFLPFEYKGKKENFIRIFSDFGKKFRHKKVGDIIKIGKTAYKVWAIT